MQKLIYFVLNRSLRLIVGFLFVISAACDDEEHKGVQVVNDKLEGSIDWQFVNVAPAEHKAIVANTVSASSSHSLSTTSTVGQSDGFSFWRLLVKPSEIPVGASLELTVKVKVTNVTGNGVFLSMRGDDTSSTSLFFETTQGIKTINGSSDFANYSLTLDSFPEGVKQMYIFLIVDGTSTGSVNFDDISLVSHSK